MSESRQIPVNIERLRELLGDAVWHIRQGEPPSVLVAVTDDSRLVVDDAIFVAVKGFETDGHLYLEKAAAAGAGLLIVEGKHVAEHPELIAPVEDKPLLIVENTRLAASILADEFYGHPSHEVKIHGVTGTKGKTTCVHLTGDILRASGRRPALIGTLGIEFEENHWSSNLTTPGPIDFHKWLRTLVDLGATDIVCEVSAHAGAMSRTSSVRFETVTYMNLSRDHGDHFLEDEYLDAKLVIARDAVKCNPDVWGIGNIRDPHTPEFLEPIAPDKRIIFAAFEEHENPDDPPNDISTAIQSRSSHDLHLIIRTKTWERAVTLPLIGRFNAQNAAASASVAMATGLGPDDIAQGLENANPIPGRLEKIDMGQEFLVVVDYAHAPQPALEVLSTLREITLGKMICIMGAGGSRDRGKRPMIGEILARNCDIAVITSDNPRREEPLDIINDILVGVSKVSNGKAEIIVEVDRGKAIDLALAQAGPGDTVAVLGKGHETYQIFSDETIHFDDREVTREWLEAHGYGSVK